MTSIVSTDHLEELQDAIQGLINRDTNHALEILQGILKKNPEVPEALHLLGLCSLLLGESGRAIELFSNAHELDPECRDYVDALASIKAKTGDINSSLYFAKLATTLEPHPELSNLTPPNLQNYAESLMQVNVPSYILEAMLKYTQRSFHEAAKMCEKELRLHPTSVEALQLLGNCLIETGEYTRAEIAFHAAEQIEPGIPKTIAPMAQSLLMQGKNDDALACFAYAQSEDEEDVSAIARHIDALSFMDDRQWQSRGEIDELYLARAQRLGIERMEGGDTPPPGKIRIGILSDSFYNSDTALVLEVFLQNYDRKRFEVFCLQQSITNDATTERLKTLCDSWRPVFDLDDYVLASIISGDGIQALIDLTGFGPGNRRATLTANPAPLQVAWFNHLDGTGKDVIDLILSDEATVENDNRTALAGQETEELESGIFAFSEFSLMADVNALPALELDTITFGAYADVARVDAHLAMTWCGILKAVPKSMLVLNVSSSLPDEIRKALASRFAHFGMTKRVAFLDNTPAPDNDIPNDPEQVFLEGVDIMLDAPVQSSPGRTARALWMGVPVLTLDTGRRSGQVAACVLTSAGKGEWVAKTSEEFIKTAHNLASDTDALANLRQNLRNEIKGSRLFKGRDFAREIETVIEMALENKGVI